MDSDRQLRAQVVSALEAVTPPAPWLASTIRRSLSADPGRGGRKMVAAARFTAGGLLPAIAVALVLLLVATAVGIFAVRSFQHPVPAHRAESDVVRYAALLTRDKRFLDEAYGRTVRVFNVGNPCDGSVGGSGCLARVGAVEGAYQGWLDDLDHTTPPARFAAEHARMRADLEALVVVFRGMVSSGPQVRPGTFPEVQDQLRDELLTIEEYVLYESTVGEPVRDAPTAAYMAMVARDYDNLHLIALSICRYDNPVCAGPEATTRSGIQAFLADLRATTPPARLATTHGDGALVYSLESELRRLDEVDAAMASGDLGHRNDTLSIAEVALLAELNARGAISTDAGAILYWSRL